MGTRITAAIFFLIILMLFRFSFTFSEKCTEKQLVYGMEIQVEQMEMYYYVIAAPIRWRSIRTQFLRTRWVV